MVEGACRIVAEQGHSGDIWFCIKIKMKGTKRNVPTVSPLCPGGQEEENACEGTFFRPESGLPGIKR